MTVLDYILDGFEVELALERELGVREVPCERGLIAVSEPPKKIEAERTQAEENVSPARDEPQRVEHLPPKVEVLKPKVDETSDCYDIVFLHDKPLTPFGTTLMSKAILGLKTTADRSPILFTGTLPRAHAYVIMGSLAMNKWFPGMKGAPGQYPNVSGLKHVLITYSPAYFEKFAQTSPILAQAKQKFWQSLKGVMQRVRVEKGERI